MVYRTSVFVQIFIWLFVLLLCGVFIVTPGSPIQRDKIIVYIAIVPMFIALLLAAINISMASLYIGDDAITLRTLFTNRTLAISNIRGYSLTKTSKSARLVFIPVNSTDKKISIAIDNFTGSKDIIEYVKSNFQDLDKVLYQEELNEILQDEQLGFSVEERKSFLFRRKLLAITINILAVVSTILMLFLRSSSLMWKILPLFFCLSALLLVCFSRGVVQLIGRFKSPRPTVAVAFIVPPAFFLIYASENYELYSLQAFWLQCIEWSVIIFIVFALLFFGISKRTKEKGAIALLAGVAFVLAAGCLVFSNCYFDHSRAEIFEAKVMGKWIQGGKSTKHYLDLSAWGKYTEEDRENVSSSFYDAVNIGDSIEIRVKQGKNHIPWYTLRKEDPPAEIKK